MKEAGTNLYYQKQLRQKLRNNATPAERILWQHLRKKQLLGLKWRRQVSIGRYIVDFYCFENKTVIELDGDTHFLNDEVIKYDKERTLFLERNGVRVIRFTNLEIRDNTFECLEKLKSILSP